MSTSLSFACASVTPGTCIRDFEAQQRPRERLGFTKSSRLRTCRTSFVLRASASARSPLIFSGRLASLCLVPRLGLIDQPPPSAVVHVSYLRRLQSATLPDELMALLETGLGHPNGEPSEGVLSLLASFCGFDRASVPLELARVPRLHTRGLE